MQNTVGTRHQSPSRGPPFEALLATTQQVCDERKGRPEGKEAQGLLSTITTEECIALACLADSGEGAIVLTRFLDNESFDQSALSSQLADFVARSRVLMSRLGPQKLLSIVAVCR